MISAEPRERLSIDPAAAALRLAVLHGFRARADAAEGSDWDIGVLADDPPDLPALSATLIQILGTDEVDVVDLSRTSALLRYRAARDGIPLLERPSDEFQHAYAELDLRRVHTAATSGPADLRAFLAALRDHAGWDRHRAGQKSIAG